MGRACVAGVLLAAWLPCTAAGSVGARDRSTEASRSTSARRTATPVVLDGRLVEETWALAPVISDFIQRNPDQGRPATERTEVRLIYDDEALYVGARLFDHQPGSIVRRLSRRDAEASSDLFRLYLDPHHDHRTGVVFTVSAAGSLADAWLSNDFDSDSSWDGVWDARVAVDAQGWTVEMRIPFSQLRFPPGAQQTWGLNISRYVQRTNEESWWVQVDKTDTRVVSRFGHVSGLDAIHPRRHVDMLPYASTSVERMGTARPGDPLNGPNRLMGGAGLDFKWGVTSSFTLDGAVNPDFGQVEVDPAVVNLTAFETFFPEQRPFFIEGAQQFNTFGRNGLVLYGRFGATYPRLWYSRRVGRAPRLRADGEYVDEPTSTTILGAAKLTGRTASGWSLSLVDAVTDSEWAKVANGETRTSTEVEPRSNYVAARVSRDLGGRGAIGVLATAVNRSLGSEALRSATASGAYAGGVDGYLHLDAQRSWVLSGSFAGSHVRGDPSAITLLQRSSARYFQRADATHLGLESDARSLSGWTGQINLNRTQGNLLVDAAVWAISPGFESNDVGFSPAADRIGTHSGWLWQKTTPDRWTRDRTLVGIGRWMWNTAGDLLLHGYSLQSQATWKNYWGTSLNADLDLPALDDRGTRGGPLMRRPAAYSVQTSLVSDPRRRVQFTTDAGYGGNREGGWNLDVTPAVVVRPWPSLRLSFGPSLSRGRSVAQYVTAAADPTATATYGRRTVFADLDRTEVSLVSRVNVVFSPRASLEVYLQPLVSAGRFWNLKELAHPRTFDFLRYGIDTGTLAYDPTERTYTIHPAAGSSAPITVPDPDFNYRSLRVNAVFRWEWRLGSTLYAVWTQQREDAVRMGDFGLGRDLRAMFGAPGDHVVMVKLAYWLSR